MCNFNEDRMKRANVSGPLERVKVLEFAGIRPCPIGATDSDDRLDGVA